MVHSADGHVFEPGDLFTTRLPENLRASATRRDTFESNGRVFSHNFVGIKGGEQAGILSLRRS
jgi:hypothetical protein